MSICYFKSNNNNYFSQKPLERNVRNLKKILNINLDVNILKDIIKGILSDFCRMSVIGYDKKYDKYWCKSYDNKFCVMHIELEIIGFSNLSIIKIIPLIGNNILIDNFVSNFTESIQLYTTSSFIKACLERNAGL